jgi:hypothetical protein
MFCQSFKKKITDMYDIVSACTLSNLIYTWRKKYKHIIKFDIYMKKKIQTVLSRTWQFKNIILYELLKLCSIVWFLPGICIKV